MCLLAVYHAVTGYVLVIKEIQDWLQSLIKQRHKAGLELSGSSSVLLYTFQGFLLLIWFPPFFAFLVMLFKGHLQRAVFYFFLCTVMIPRAFFIKAFHTHPVPPPLQLYAHLFSPLYHPFFMLLYTYYIDVFGGWQETSLRDLSMLKILFPLFFFFFLKA